MKKGIINKAKHFRDELKGRTVTAIVTALALVIGLSWQTTLKAIVDTILTKITPASFTTLVKYTILYNAISSILITIVCVIGIVFITKGEKK